MKGPTASWSYSKILGADLVTEISCIKVSLSPLKLHVMVSEKEKLSKIEWYSDDHSYLALVQAWNKHMITGQHQGGDMVNFELEFYTNSVLIILNKHGKSKGPQTYSHMSHETGGLLSDSMLLRTWQFKSSPLSRFPQSGLNTAVLLLDAEPEQAAWPPSAKPPVSRKEVFFCQKEGHIVYPPLFPETCPCTIVERGDSNVRLTQNQPHTGGIPTFHLISNWDTDTTLALNCKITGSNN